MAKITQQGDFVIFRHILLLFMLRRLKKERWDMNWIFIPRSVTFNSHSAKPTQHLEGETPFKFFLIM